MVYVYGSVYGQQKIVWPKKGIKQRKTILIKLKKTILGSIERKRKAFTNIIFRLNVKSSHTKLYFIWFVH